VDYQEIAGGRSRAEWKLDFERVGMSNLQFGFSGVKWIINGGKGERKGERGLL